MPHPIELAPHHKKGLPLRGPLILASGSVEEGEETCPSLGALVTIPLTLRPRAGGPAPRVIEIPGGFLLRTGGANPGLAKTLHDSRRAWARFGATLPVIVACAAQGASEWPEMASHLEHVPGVGGIECLLNPTFDGAAAIRAVRAVSELPLIAKLDLDDPNLAEVASACVKAGANALAIGRPPRGMALIDGRPWYGRLYGPVVKPIALRILADLAALNLQVPLVASGGVHSAHDVLDFLAAGACAVEIDSAVWVDPQAVTGIARELEKMG